MLDEFDLLTLDQVAQVLHISKAHVSKVITGRVDGCSPIPVLHLGRRKLVRRTTLESWMKENDKIAASPERGRKSA
jgi:plasmid maintenance system antidote protein VapI